MLAGAELEVEALQRQPAQLEGAAPHAHLARDGEGAVGRDEETQLGAAVATVVAEPGAHAAPAQAQPVGPALRAGLERLVEPHAVGVPVSFEAQRRAGRGGLDDQLGHPHVELDPPGAGGGERVLAGDVPRRAGIVLEAARERPEQHGRDEREHEDDGAADEQAAAQAASGALGSRVGHGHLLADTTRRRERLFQTEAGRGSAGPLTGTLPRQLTWIRDGVLFRPCDVPAWLPPCCSH